MSDPGLDLSPESLLAEARAQAGLADFGDRAFRDGLDVLVETYETTANLSPAGRKRTRRRLVQLLVDAAARRGGVEAPPGDARASRSAAPST